MRIFIHHSAKGNIISVSKVEVMHASLAHPFAGLAEGDRVLEIKPTSELEGLYCHEIYARYLVDLKNARLITKKLVTK